METKRPVKFLRLLVNLVVPLPRLIFPVFILELTRGCPNLAKSSLGTRESSLYVEEPPPVSGHMRGRKVANRSYSR